MMDRCEKWPRSAYMASAPVMDSMAPGQGQGRRVAGVRVSYGSGGWALPTHWVGVMWVGDRWRSRCEM